MRYRTQVSGDFAFGAQPGKGFLLEAEATIQAIVTRLNLLLGEWWENLDEGLPLFEEILVYNANLNNIELIINERIALAPGVERIEESMCSQDNSTRTLMYQAEIYINNAENGISLRLGFDGIHFYRR